MARNQDFGTRAARLRERFGDPTVELHAAYDSWIEDQVSRPGNEFVPVEFDLEKHPEQSIYEPRTLATPPSKYIPDAIYYPAFKRKMARSLGKSGLERLISQYSEQPVSADDPKPLVQRLIADQQNDRNTLAVTSHFTFSEFGYNKAIRHIAKRDRPNIPKNGVLMGKLMTRQSIRGKKLVDHFSSVGDVWWSYQKKSASAIKHCVPTTAIDLGNSLLKMAIDPELEAGGMELDAALTGKQIERVYDEAGDISHYAVPDIEFGSIGLLEKFHNAFSTTLIRDPVDGEWRMKISDLLDIQELLKTHDGAEIMDMIYGDIATAIQNIVRKDVVYNKLAPGVGKSAISTLVSRLRLK